jgi:superfamily I DNA/RNA helicase
MRAVWVRADAPSAERNVFVAHEIAHLHLHHASGEESGMCHCADSDFAETDMFLSTGYGPRQRRETEANVFAREFLLPTLLAKRLFDSGWDARQIALRLGLPLPVVFNQLEAATHQSVNSPVPIGIRRESLSPLTGLDDSQRAAATMEQGPLLVVAGPGTGKTRTLVARVLFLVQERGVAPDNLLLITFTRKAVEEMRERLAAVEPEIARRAAIHTYHSYGLDLLRRHGKAAGLPPTPILLEKADVVSLLERHAASLGLTALRYLHDLSFPLPDVYDSISRAKDEMLTPQDYAQRAVETEDPRLEDAARVFAAYEHLLEKYGALDYSDLVGRSVRLLEENETIRAAERAQFQHILVDEYQDINRSGARLIKALAGEGKGLWVVGDVRQAIYAFRGASPENVSQFERDYPNGQRLDLAVNYRSRATLVSLFGTTAKEGADKWKPARDSADEPEATATFAIATTDIDQADGIAQRITQFHAEGYRYREMAILCRTRRQAKSLRTLLSERGVPVAAPPDENGLLSVPDARKMVAVLSRSVDPTGPASRAFPELPPGLPFRGDAVEFWSELLWGTPGWARQVQDIEAVSRLLTLARSFRERSGVLIGPRDDNRREFLRHLRRIARYGGNFGEAEDDETTDTVQVMTVHAAKGLEFPIVFVPNLSRDMFPSRPGLALLPPLVGMEGDATREEEARLFFVALTRARDHLILSRANRYNRRSYDPSPLIELVDCAPELRHEDWRSPSPPTAAVYGEPPPIESEDFIPLPEKPTVRVEDVDIYLRCPRRYYYEHIVGLKSNERTPYSSFIRSVTEALTADNPLAELEDAMERHGLEEDHPHAPVYREVATEIVQREAEKAIRFRGEKVAFPRRLSRAERPEMPTLQLTLANGTITIQPDAMDSMANTFEWQTFGKPPETPEPVTPEDGRPFLLHEAVRRSNPQNTPHVQIRYMQSGATIPLKDSVYHRKKHLQAYEGALRGMRLKMFDPSPRDPVRDCPTCPYYFICPEE